MLTIKHAAFFLAFLGSCFLGCGGGGGAGISGNELLPSKTVSWDPPTTYTDGSNILSPKDELAGFEIYVNQNNNFSTTDNCIFVRAIDPGTGQLVSSFDLSKYPYPMSKGVVYYVAIRAIAITTLIKSDFSVSATFSF